MPKIFVASSVEGLEVARGIRSNLEHDAEVIIWNEGVFRPSRHALESLLGALKEVDFAVFVCSPDDVAILRHEEHSVVRDNVVLELGMSLGRLERLRTFIVQPRGTDLRLPTDLAGITPLTYDPTRLSNPISALGSACDAIRRELEDASLLFPRDGAFGPNILHPDLVELEQETQYSVTAAVPFGRGARILIKSTDRSSGSVQWSMPLGPAHGFDAKVCEGDQQEFVSVGDGLLHTPIMFDRAGQAAITAWLDDECVLTKHVEWA